MTMTFIILRVVAIALVVIPLALSNKDSRDGEYTKKKKIVYSTVAFIGIFLFITSIFYRWLKVACFFKDSNYIYFTDVLYNAILLVWYLNFVGGYIMKTFKKAKYEVLNDKNEIVISGNLLSEIIETTILNTFKFLESEKNLLSKIEKNYFSYYNDLATIYKSSDSLYWNNIEYIEMIHNNVQFLDSSRFIKFRKNTWELTDSKNQIKLSKNRNIFWKK